MPEPDNANFPKTFAGEVAGDEATRAESIQASIARLVKQSQELLQTGEKLEEEVEAMRQASNRKHVENETGGSESADENPDSPMG
jgi:hypothetical protein